MTANGSSALADIRVIDFGQYLAGPLVTLLLAEHGADVIRVDPPGGPRWQHPANAVLHRSKRSVVLDLHEAGDLGVARDLIASADVVVEGFRPGVMGRLGLDPVVATASNGRLIWCSIPGFGKDDPRAELPGWEGIVSSAAGLYPSGIFAIHSEPRFSAVPMASTFAAAIAAHSIAGALVSRARGDQGELIEVPLFDAAFDAIAIFGEEPGTMSQAGFDHRQNRIANPAFSAESPYACGDGRFIGHCGSPPRGLHRFWDALLPEDLKMASDPEAEKEARAALSALFRKHDAREWEQIMQEDFGAAVASTMTSAEWLQDDHAQSSGTVATVEDPYLGPTRQAGAVLTYGDGPTAVRFPRRMLGADTEAVKAEAATWRAQGELPSPFDPSVRTELPLAGIRVLDVSNLLAGPVGGRVLAEYGADVIKINKASIGLGIPDPMADDPVTFVGHRTTGAGKRTMFLDLKSGEGRAIFDQLVGTADVVHTNMPPDTALHLGLDEARLRGVRSDIIYSSSRLHASGGWRSAFRGHEDLAEHVTGMSVRYGGGIPDSMHGIIVNDHATGHFAAFGVLVAVLNRLRTGRGDVVETSLSQTATYFQIPYMISYDGARWDEPQGREATGWSPSDGLFRTQDRWLWIAGVGDLGDLLAANGYGGPTSSVEETLRTRTAGQWEQDLRSWGVAAHAYVPIADVMEDEVAIARGLSVTRDHPGLGAGREVGTIRRFASRPDATLAPASAPGWHTGEILEELGRADQVDDLLARHVVATNTSRRPATSEPIPS